MADPEVSEKLPAGLTARKMSDKSTTITGKSPESSQDSSPSKKSREGSPKVEIETVQLKRTIGVWSAIAILVTNTGGSAVFISPTSVLRYGGSPGVTLILWLLAGFLNLGLAVCFMEVALVLPKAGGPYWYIMEVWGSFPGFLMLWGFLTLIMAPSWALSAITSSLYFTSLVNPSCPPPDTAVKLLAAWLMVTLVVVNCLYMKYTTKVQSLLSAFKIIACVIVILTGLATLGSETAMENLQAFMDGSSTDAGSLALGIFAGYFSYGGWQIITIIMEEVQEPAKNVPKALACAFAIVITISVLINLSYFIVLSPAEMLQSDAAAMTFSQRIHPALTVTVSVLIALSTLGVLNVLIMGQPRMLFAGGRIGHMPRVFSMLSRKYHTPWPPTFLVAIAALIMLVSGTVATLINTMSLLVCLMVVAVMATLLYLRWKKPDINRPFKVPLWLPVLELVLAVVILGLSVAARPAEFGRLLVVLACGVPVYVVGVWWQGKPKSFLRFMDEATEFLKWFLDVEKPQSS